MKTELLVLVGTAPHTLGRFNPQLQHSLIQLENKTLHLPYVFASNDVYAIAYLIQQGRGLPKQTVFNVCKEYKEKGWIEFSESAVDKREKMMSLTADGKAKAEPIWAATHQLSDKVFAKFGKRKTEQLFALMAEFCVVCREQIDKTEITDKVA